MQSRKILSGLTVVLAMFAMATLTTGTRAAAQTEKVLHSFSFSNDGKDGNQPFAGLIFDAAGNLYGTTSGGGRYGGGTVFELMPARGGWTYKILHAFGSTNDGSEPYAGLIFDAAGNLYGTTVNGGVYGVGTIFEMKPAMSGAWAERILYSFNNNGKDGQNPYAGLIFDASGNLYGTTVYGGPYGYGTVFELKRQPEGWAERIVHNFGNGTDGNGPYGGLIFDAAGNLYGTTAYGGASGNTCGLPRPGCGTAFELIKSVGWTERILHSFTGAFDQDGSVPLANLVFDSVGNLYGTTSAGAYDGTAFELTPHSGGWRETILQIFGNNNITGFQLDSGLIFDAAGNLYGTTFYGTGSNCCGTVFELTPGGGAFWTETVLYNFGGGTDGILPAAGLIFDAPGNLYGTTTQGGVYNNGTVFEITP
jgi:uncharacterized repeat protein (TIGR03803 family)